MWWHTAYTCGTRECLHDVACTECTAYYRLITMYTWRRGSTDRVSRSLVPPNVTLGGVRSCLQRWLGEECWRYRGWGITRRVDVVVGARSENVICLCSYTTSSSSSFTMRLNHVENCIYSTLHCKWNYLISCILGIVGDVYDPGAGLTEQKQVETCGHLANELEGEPSQS